MKNYSSTVKKWIVGVSGSSGMPYALRLIDFLSSGTDEVHAIFSEAALRVLYEELDIKCSQSTISSKILLGNERANVYFHNPKDIGAWCASGSAQSEGMVIVPCSMASLGLIANGSGNNLIHRAADVCLKEGRRLVIVPRETPLSQIHLENMLKLSRLGVRMVPAMPGFYHKPERLSDLVDMMVMKILDQMGVPNDLVKRWGVDSSDFNSKEPIVVPIKGGKF
ncbi:MAG: flavin prenyltransferase UbiX [bacterium]|nr:flavin prenyltransferase UbiX [bacterium]